MKEDLKNTINLVVEFLSSEDGKELIENIIDAGAKAVEIAKPVIEKNADLYLDMIENTAKPSIEITKQFKSVKLSLKQKAKLFLLKKQFNRLAKSAKSSAESYLSDYEDKISDRILDIENMMEEN